LWGSDDGINKKRSKASMRNADCLEPSMSCSDLPPPRSQRSPR
jgi:hypothetical protein